MKLLFSLDDAGSDLLSELLGFSDADFKIKNLKGDLFAATDDIIEIIGPDIYQSIVGIYEEDSVSTTNEELLYRTQLAIAINAYRSFAPDNDISHTNSGRVVRVEENQKIPWEWQIDRSNKSLERKYYKAVDALLNYLDLNVPAWKETPAYKATHALFVRTTKDFDDYFDIGRSRLLLIKLSPGLRLAEASDIKPRIGQATFDEMKAKLKSSEEVDADLLAKIKEACVYKALAWGMRRLSVQLFPEGVLQFRASEMLSTQGKTPALNSEAEATAQRFEEDAARCLLEIETTVTRANQVIPEYLPEHTPYFDENDHFIST